MYNICNHPDRMECVDDRCWLSVGCKYLERCAHQLVDSVYSGMSCACNYIEGGLQVYQSPNCIVYTDSPTISPSGSPSMSPSLSPTNSSMVGHTIEESVTENIDDNLVYYISGPVVFLLIVLGLCFRKHIGSYLGNCNRVADEDENA
jgi:hypothetical protein